MGIFLSQFGLLKAQKSAFCLAEKGAKYAIYPIRQSRLFSRIRMKRHEHLLVG
jgi:hypothetical protein